MANEYVADLVGTGERILVIENNPVQRELFYEILAVNGYKVLIAENSIQAIALYQKYNKKIDLVLTDLKFPNLMEFISYLRQFNLSAKVIFTSTSFRKPSFLNIDEFKIIKKPLDILELFQAIRSSLRTEVNSQ